MVMKDIEQRLEGMVEGLFARVFKSRIRPVEISRRLIREMDHGRSVGVKGETVVPNNFVVHLSLSDHQEFEGIADSMTRELTLAGREHARDESYHFMGPLEVTLLSDEAQRESSFRIVSQMLQGEGGGGAGSLILPTGERVVLGDFVVTVGRLPDCTITLNDPNVSRNHAEIHPDGTRFKVIDLGSTNGTKVDGNRIGEYELTDGDVVIFGSTPIEFAAS